MMHNSVIIIYVRDYPYSSAYPKHFEDKYYFSHASDLNFGKVPISYALWIFKLIVES